MESFPFSVPLNRTMDVLIRTEKSPLNLRDQCRDRAATHILISLWRHSVSYFIFLICLKLITRLLNEFWVLQRSTCVNLFICFLIRYLSFYSSNQLASRFSSYMQDPGHGSTGSICKTVGRRDAATEPPGTGSRVSGELNPSSRGRAASSGCQFLVLTDLAELIPLAV